MGLRLVQRIFCQVFASVLLRAEQLLCVGHAVSASREAPDQARDTKKRCKAADDYDVKKLASRDGTSCDPAVHFESQHARNCVSFR